MAENDLQVFIDGTVHYFAQMATTKAAVGTPYLADQSQSINQEFTGIIGISGRRKGSVYFTAPKRMLQHLLQHMGETDASQANLCDLVGEVANTISGNARREFGKEFMISVPVVIAGEPRRIANPDKLRSFIIPIDWNGMHAFLVICLE